MSELFVSRLGKMPSKLTFGVMQFGGRADEAQSREMFDACRDAGINAFDTAYMYNGGESERLLGKFAKDERDDLIIISKCVYHDGPLGSDLRGQVEESLRRLGTDYLDVLYFHQWIGLDRMEEALGIAKALHEEGKFRVLGASNFAAWQTMKTQYVAEKIGAPPITILQPMYNLVKRQVEVEILPMAIAEGLAVHPYSPLGGGLLTGKYASGGSGRLKEDKMYTDRYSQDWMHQTASDFAALAERHGVDPATLGVAWVAHHPGITSPIISARNVEQLRPSLAAADFVMTDELYAEINALTRTPPPATDRLEEAL
jgi:1-deoxyxylulose-5-phosphate synthase